MSMLSWVLSVTVWADYLISFNVDQPRFSSATVSRVSPLRAQTASAAVAHSVNRPSEVTGTVTEKYVVADCNNDRHPVVFSGQRGLFVHHDCWHHRIHRSLQHGALPFQWTRFRLEWRSPGCGCPEPPRPTGALFDQSMDGLRHEWWASWHVGSGCRRPQSSDG